MSSDTGPLPTPSNKQASIQDPTTTQSSTTTSETPALSDSDLQRYTALYFGYASNLSPVTLKQRCPDSLFVSLGVLKGHKWMINETGYANIIPTNDPTDEVWGSLCFLSKRDEMALDESEGVPWLYEKQYLKVERMPGKGSGEEWGEGGGMEVEVMTYVDVQRLTEGKIEKEYIVWVKKAVKDAGLHGLPESYVKKYIEKWIPEPVEGDLSEQEIMMVRTLRFGETSAGLVPRGFASWDRG